MNDMIIDNQILWDELNSLDAREAYMIDNDIYVPKALLSRIFDLQVCLGLI